jgi:hypothetical protein
MSLERSDKRGNVKNFQDSYTKGFKNVIPTEVDADLNILFEAWNTLADAPPSAPPIGPAGGALTGTYPDPDLASLAVHEGHIFPGSVTATKIPAHQISGGASGLAHIVANSIVGGDIQVNTITDLHLMVDSVTTTRIKAGAVSDAKISDVAWSKVTGAPVIPVVPASLPPNGPAGGDLAGTYPNPTLKAGMIPTALPPNGPASGDLTGSYPNPAILAGAVTDAKITSVSYAKVTGAPASLPPSGPAGGVLAGTYPNPTNAPGAIVNADINAAANIDGVKLLAKSVDGLRLTKAVYGRVYRSTTHALASGAWTSVSWTGFAGLYTASAGISWSAGTPTRLICADAGLYIVGAGFGLTGTASVVHCLLYRGVSLVLAAETVTSPGYFSIFAIAEVSAGEYFEVQFLPNAAINIDPGTLGANLYAARIG